jgi:hypothetical protein
MKNLRIEDYELCFYEGGPTVPVITLQYFQIIIFILYTIIIGITQILSFSFDPACIIFCLFPM